MDLKQQLIRLGYEQPELRRHLAPILDSLTGRKTASRRKQANVFEKARSRDSVIGPSWIDEIPESDLKALERDVIRIIEGTMSRFTAREAKQAHDKATSAAYKLYQKYQGSVDEGILEQWYDTVSDGIAKYLANIFEELAYEAQDSDDEWSEAMVDEYWEIMENIQRFGF